MFHSDAAAPPVDWSQLRHPSEEKMGASKDVPKDTITENRTAAEAQNEKSRP